MWQVRGDVRASLLSLLPSFPSPQPACWSSVKGMPLLQTAAEVLVTSTPASQIYSSSQDVDIARAGVRMNKAFTYSVKSKIKDGIFIYKAAKVKTTAAVFT